MTDEPSNRDIYAAIMDLRGRMEALAWDLTAIEERLELLTGREESDEADDAVDVPPWSRAAGC